MFSALARSNCFVLASSSAALLLEGVGLGAIAGDLVGGDGDLTVDGPPGRSGDRNALLMLGFCGAARGGLFVVRAPAPKLETRDGGFWGLSLPGAMEWREERAAEVPGVGGGAIDCRFGAEGAPLEDDPTEDVVDARLPGGPLIDCRGLADAGAMLDGRGLLEGGPVGFPLPSSWGDCGS
jgi:hypothetical protein